MSKYFVTWQEVDNFITDVIRWTATKHFTGVYGLPRGGLVFAVMLSHKLNIPMLAHAQPGCLIVDDICDSGESLLHYYKNTSGNNTQKDISIATMFYKQNILGVVPDFYKYTKDDKWIVFPWENKEE